MQRAKTVLTPSMIEENKSLMSTGWVDLAGTAMRYGKRHLPNAPQGSPRYTQLFRTEQGEAYTITACDGATVRTGAKLGEVEINGKSFEILSPVKFARNAKGVRCYLKREDGACFTVKRDETFDLKSTEE